MATQAPVVRRNVATGPQAAAADASPAVQAPPAPIQPGAAPKLQVRAKFTVTEVTKTAAGSARLTLSAQHDALNSARFMDHASPKGSITIEVDPKFADLVQMGSAYYLVSA